MAANLYKHQDQNVFKTWTLMAGFLVVIVLLGWWFSFYYNSPGILYFAIIFSLLMNFFSYWNSDKIVLRITGAKPVKREEYFDLYNSVENLAITAGLPTPKVYVIDDPVPNAFATGRNKEHAVIAVTSGLLKILDRTELEGVIAHEMAHIGNRDILLQTVIVVLVGFVTILSDIFMRSMFYGNNRRSNNGGGGILIFIGIGLVILSPIVATIMQLAISRKREYLADATGALLTRYPEGLARALEKISSNSGQKMRKANHATAHMFIANPFGPNNKQHKQSFLTKIFSTHPPIEDRVANLRGLTK
jgi:heat shock protein HtpX